MTDARTALDALFAELDITPVAIEHPPVHTVEEALPYWSALEGVHTKNLLLKGAKGGLWLVCVPTDRRLDLKALAVQLVLAADMMSKPRITVHPLVNTATVSLTSAELLKFVAATGHRAEIVDFDRLPAS
jgi:Ala-tRNA(Pro) deacylase